MKAFAPSLSWIKQPAREIGLEPEVVYKWMWDQRKKISSNEELLEEVMKSTTARRKDGPYKISATDGKGNSLTQAQIGRSFRRPKKLQD